MARNTQADPIDRLATKLEAMSGRLTELVELSRGGALNHILWSGTRIIPDDGWVTVEPTVPMASIAIGAHAATGTVTAVAAPPGDMAPLHGPGVYIVPPGIFLAVPATGNFLTVWGTPGDSVYIGVFSRLMPPTGS